MGELNVGSLVGSIELEDNLTPALMRASGQLVAAGRYVTEFGKTLLGAGQNADSAGSIISGVFTRIAISAGIVVGAIGAAASAIIGFGVKGSRLVGVEDAFHNLASAAGVAGDALLGSLNKGLQGTVDSMDQLQSMNTLLSSKMRLTSKQAEDLGEAARAIGRATGGDATSGLNSLTAALQRGNDRALRSVGIRVDMKKAEDDFAKSIGTTADKLNDAGKLEAKRLGILAETEAWLKRVGTASLSFGERITQARLAVGNFFDDIAKAVARSISVNAAITEIGNAISRGLGGGEFRQSVIDAIVTGIDRFSDGVRRLAPYLEAAIVKVRSFWDWLVSLNERYQITEKLTVSVQAAFSFLRTAFGFVEAAARALMTAWAALPDWLKKIAEYSVLSGVGLYAVGKAAGAVTSTFTGLVSTVDTWVNVVTNVLASGNMLGNMMGALAKNQGALGTAFRGLSLIVGAVISPFETMRVLMPAVTASQVALAASQSRAAAAAAENAAMQTLLAGAQARSAVAATGDAAALSGLIIAEERATLASAELSAAQLELAAAQGAAGTAGTAAWLGLLGPLTWVATAIGLVTYAIKEATGSWTTALTIMLPPIGLVMRAWQELRGEMKKGWEEAKKQKESWVADLMQNPEFGSRFGMVAGVYSGPDAGTVARMRTYAETLKDIMDELGNLPTAKVAELKAAMDPAVGASFEDISIKLGVSVGVIKAYSAGLYDAAKRAVDAAKNTDTLTFSIEDLGVNLEDTDYTIDEFAEKLKAFTKATDEARRSQIPLTQAQKDAIEKWTALDVSLDVIAGRYGFVAGAAKQFVAVLAETKKLLQVDEMKAFAAQIDAIGKAFGSDLWDKADLVLTKLSTSTLKSLSEQLQKLPAEFRAGYAGLGEAISKELADPLRQGAAVWLAAQAQLKAVREATTKAVGEFIGRDKIEAATVAVRQFNAAMKEAGGIGALSTEKIRATMAIVDDAVEVAIKKWRSMPASITLGFNGVFAAIQTLPKEVRQAADQMATYLAKLEGPLKNLTKIPTAIQFPAPDTRALDAMVETMTRVGASTRSIAQGFINLAQVSGGTMGEVVGAIGQVAVAIDNTVQSIGNLAKAFADKAKGFQGAGAAIAANLIAGITSGIGGIIDAGKNAGSALTAAMKGGASGAMAGATIGVGIAMIGTTTAKGMMVAGIWGAVAGFVIGAIIAVWMSSGTRRVMHQVGEAWGSDISEGLAKKLKADAKSVFAGSMDAAQVWNLSKTISEKGISTTQTWTTALGKLRDAFSMLETGQFSVGQAQQVLNDNFKTFVDMVGGHLTPALKEIIRLNERFGTQSKAIADFMDAAANSAMSALGKVIGMRGEVVAALATAQKALDELIKKGSNSDDIKKAQSEVDRLAKMLAALPMTAEGAEAYGGALLGIFARLTKDGADALEVIKNLTPIIDSLASQLDAAGMSGGAAFDQIRSMAALAADEVTGPALSSISALGLALEGLNDSNILTPEMFRGIADQVGATVTQLEAQGKTADEIYPFIASSLQTIWELQKDYGYTVDDATQSLLDQAEAEGVVGDKHRSVQEQMLIAMQRVADTLDLIAKKWGIDVSEGIDNATNAVTTFADNIDQRYKNYPKEWEIDVNTTYTSTGERPMPGGSGGGGGVGGEGSFAQGGVVYAASGFFTPRGTDTVPAMLTPGEGVVSLSGMNNLARMALNLINNGPTAAMPSVPGLMTAAPPRETYPERGRDRPEQVSIVINAIDTQSMREAVERDVAPMLNDIWRRNGRGTRTDAKHALGFKA